MKMSEAFPSKYLRAVDLPKHPRYVEVTMGDCMLESVDPNKEDQPVLYFKGKNKGLVLNKTNGNTIADAYGDDSDGWKGKQVQLFATTTDYQGKRVPCIRCQVPNNEPEVTNEPDMDADGIPF